MPKESTTLRIASIAAVGLTRPHLLTMDQIIAVCASCLTQFEAGSTIRKRLKVRSKKAKPKKAG